MVPPGVDADADVATEYLPGSSPLNSPFPYRVGDLELGALDNCGTLSGEVLREALKGDPC